MTVGQKNIQRGWGFFAVGVLFGILLTLTLAGTFFFYLPNWLVVETQPVSADAVVVLGGGGGSRLRRGLALVDDGLALELLLVGKDRSNWDYIVKHLCVDCTLNDKRVTYLSYSADTATDAELILEFCHSSGLSSIIVVTDPYHTRRADLVFRRSFRGSFIDIQTVSSKDYNLLDPPGKNWWHDRKTLETVWQEFGKCIYVLFG